MARPLAPILDGSGRVKLDKYDPREVAGLTKEAAAAREAELGREFAELGNLLAYAGEHALLIVLQGRDASGKDGAIRKMLEHANVQTFRVEPFKVPSEEERAHDFLWRVHKVVPRRGHITVFNRSHYEDVLAARVHELVPEAVWKGRYEHINAFERLLADSGVIVVKFYLHISRDEQIERLLEREKDPRTAWKLNPGDWRELPLWDEMTEAYEEALERCSSKRLPFHLVPADRKWFRNLAVLERLVLTLRPYRDGWLKTLEAMGKGALEEIRALRRQAEIGGPGDEPKPRRDERGSAKRGDDKGASSRSGRRARP